MSAGRIQPGMRLVSLDATYPAESFLNSDGTIRLGDTDYMNVSVAGGYAKGRTTSAGTNGWLFWGVEDAKTGGLIPLDNLRQ